MLEEFTSYIASHKLFTKKDTLLVTVSGGVDSIVLAHLCTQAGFNITIAHCNFQLRGVESERDELFVKTFAIENNIPFFSKKFDTALYAQQHKVSTQVAARELRYKWFNELATLHNITYILTAHHADDQVETVLMNFLRGTGIKGLTGMDVKKGILIRPLLFARRATIENYASQKNLAYVTDSSNLKNDYTRNLLRNEIIPLTKKAYNHADENILRTTERLRDVYHIYQQAVKQKFSKWVRYENNEVHIPVLRLASEAAAKTLLWELIMPYGFESGQLVDAFNLLHSPSGKYISSQSHILLRNRNWLIITPVIKEESKHILIDAAGRFSFAEGEIEIELISARPQSIITERNCTYVNATELTFPILLRPWKQGDYFYPLGMVKKKKLSRFFIDEKLSLVQKNHTWVLETATKKIAWILNHRLDNRFRLTDKTKDVYKISFYNQPLLDK